MTCCCDDDCASASANFTDAEGSREQLALIGSAYGVLPDEQALTRKNLSPSRKLGEGCSSGGERDRYS